MKTKKTLEFKQKALSEGEVEWKGVGRGGGRPQPPEKLPPSGGISKGRGRVLASSKPVSVPGKQSSGHKHNPFLSAGHSCHAVRKGYQKEKA